jgi:RND family efflux transporter MFP subunit
MAFLAACVHKQGERIETEANRAVLVKTDTVKVAKTISKLHYSGTIEPLQTIPLSFENAGTVESVFVQEGEFVKKGQVLATIDKVDDVSLNKATEAKYRQAKDAYDRLKPVYEKGSLPEIKWIEIETSLREAEAQMQLSKSSISKCTMRAPVSGMVGKRNVEPGQSSISLKDPIELVKIETILVKISVAENEICNIKKGQKASFSISALHDKTFTGTVSSVGVVADFISRTYEVKIMAQNPDLEIKPGMVCDVNLNTAEERSCIIVSNNAVSKDNEGKSYVYLVNSDNKTVKKKIVKVNSYLNNGIEVTSGITPGQVIVIEGKEKLSDNSLISL